MEAALEQRPFPYLATEANLLRQIKESAADGLFKSFELLLGKDAREGGVKFEVLLGVYTNVVEFVKFLETALAAACVNTEFRDLRRMTDGKIQFKISVPTIAYGDGRRPNKQKQYIVMKTCNKHHIGAEIELATADIELLFSEKETPLDFTEYAGAVKTITSSLQFGVDALERGLVDTVLNVKLRHAPPIFILKTLGDPVYSERGLKKAVKADMLAMFKTYLIDHSFFLDKADMMARGKQYVLSMLSDLVGAVCADTVFKGVETYITTAGDTVAGVMETTDSVMRKLLNLLGQVESGMTGPAAYASYVVRGENLVTAISYGRAMRNFEQFMARIVDRPNVPPSVDGDRAALADGHDALQRTQIPASMVQIGDKIVALESLQRMYNETQFPCPLNRRIQYSYYFPVGLHMPVPQYSTSTSVKGIEVPPQLSTETWVVNKNNVLLSFGYHNALKSICHPRMHNPVQSAHALEQAFPDPERENAYGTAYEPTPNMNLFRIFHQYYQGKQVAFVPGVAQKALMTTDDMLHPTSHQLMRLEVHPFFDFYVRANPGERACYRATHRNMVGNIPQPLAPREFQDARGNQFEAATGLAHVIDATTMEVFQDTAFDPAYPLFCYVIEAMVHGQEEKFVMNAPLIALTIQTYWVNSGKLAFVNSFHMIRFICTHLGNGSISKEAHGHYRKIYGELLALEQALLKLAGHETVGRVPVTELVSALLDPNLLPPFAYHDVFTDLLEKSYRQPVVRIGDQNYDHAVDRATYIDLRGRMEDLLHNLVNIYQTRINEDHDERHILDVAPLNENEYHPVLEKLFYFVLLPACSNGHLCGMGVDFQNVALTLTYNGPVFADVVNAQDDILTHLENGTLKDMLEACDVRPTVDMIRILCTSFLTCPFVTQAARVVTRRDPAQSLSTHERGKEVGQTVLVNGFAAFAIADRSRDAAETLFYPVPFHKLYGDPMVAATLHPMIANYVTRLPNQRNPVVFNVPSNLMAEYEEWHKSPMAAYVSACPPVPLSLSALVSMHHKLSAPGFICQSKHRIHPGFALTVVRTDEVLAENILYSARASTSMFLGQPSVVRREVRSDAVSFEITHEIASLETALGYSSAIAPAHVAAITTDMGVHCQDLFMIFPGDAYQDRQLNEYVRVKAGAHGTGPGAAHRRDPVGYVAGVPRCDNIPGLSHGQLATCEVVPTPVTADVAYYQNPNSPRGRAACVISCDAYNNESAERLLYDHSLPDPAYEYRATNNPWASQRGSLGDVLYNTTFRQAALPGMHSPCRQFFNKEDILRHNRGLFTLVNEYSARLAGAPATSTTDLQYVVINGTDVFLDQPCHLLQEAFPTLAASHRAMLDEYMSNTRTHAPVHMGNYLIEEVAPVKRLLKLGNKLAY
ncbi:ORF25 [Retroperitoneal fibromatosis-associated herpesvirus]|uniref:ORF25 n=1 Tax=Retroperitoneal fibromatosis-associated herpesvirus TaxID=111469 RepID=U5NM45_9GAMA|nr:ORF25 [Retroperitoneal fibromatosis-associated herpesvirus]AGY30708.1 ORF25 [Retroperitoneal fibromatosis-associated herpesvirus]